MPDSSARRGIQSVGIGVAVLRALAKARGPLPLKEIAARAGMPADKAFRYLVSYVGCGMVKQDPGSAHYDLGPFALELGLAALGRINELEVVSTALQQATEATGHDAHATIWSRHGPTVIRWMQGAAEIALKVREGVVLPLLSTATGRVWAHHLPRNLTDPLFEAEIAALARASGEPAQTVRARAEARLAEVGRHGLAGSEGERRLGIDALSGPIFGPAGMAFAVTLMGPHGNVDLSPDGATARALLQALKAASLALTGSMPTTCEHAMQPSR